VCWITSQRPSCAGETWGSAAPASNARSDRSVLSHDASGALGAWSVYVAYDMPEPVVLEDMNGDSRLDVVIIHGNRGLAVGDINSDGRKDVVLADYKTESWWYPEPDPAHRPGASRRPGGTRR
jgi:hypothetical protein